MFFLSTMNEYFNLDKYYEEEKIIFRGGFSKEIDFLN